MAKIYKTNGEIIETEPKNGTDFSWEELNDIVGGNIEIIFLPNELIVLNENGKINNLPTNKLATKLYRNSVLTLDYICGDALLCNREQVK